MGLFVNVHGAWRKRRREAHCDGPTSTRCCSANIEMVWEVPQLLSFTAGGIDPPVVWNDACREPFTYSSDD